MRRGRVHIVTTEGPALVQHLAIEEGLSAVCLNGTTTRLPISRLAEHQEGVDDALARGPLS